MAGQGSSEQEDRGLLIPKSLSLVVAGDLQSEIMYLATAGGTGVLQWCYLQSYMITILPQYRHTE